jgi:hypothetical protein
MSGAAGAASDSACLTGEAVTTSRTSTDGAGAATRAAARRGAADALAADGINPPVNAEMAF